MAQAQAFQLNCHGFHTFALLAAKPIDRKFQLLYASWPSHNTSRFGFVKTALSPLTRSRCRVKSHVLIDPFSNTFAESSNSEDQSRLAVLSHDREGARMF